MKTPSTEVGPGMWAFVAFFVLALALWLLMRSMFTRLRRINLAERDRAEEARRRAEETKATRAAPIGPMKGTPEMVSAADAATIARMSGSFSPS